MDRDKAVRVVRAVVGAAGIALAGIVVPVAASAQNIQPAVKPWVGQTLAEVVARLGNPIEAEPLRETGGKLLIWVRPNGESFVFETDAGGHVIDAYVKHRPGG